MIEDWSKWSDDRRGEEKESLRAKALLKATYQRTRSNTLEVQRNINETLNSSFMHKRNRPLTSC